jgi:hypothetical protein
MTTLNLTLESRDGRTPVTVDIENLVIAGWAGRVTRRRWSTTSAELEALGVEASRPRPRPITASPPPG